MRTMSPGSTRPDQLVISELFEPRYAMRQKPPATLEVGSSSASGSGMGAPAPAATLSPIQLQRLVFGISP